MAQMAKQSACQSSLFHHVYNREKLLLKFCLLWDPSIKFRLKELISPGSNLGPIGHKASSFNDYAMGASKCVSVWGEAYRVDFLNSLVCTKMEKNLT